MSLKDMILHSRQPLVFVLNHLRVDVNDAFNRQVPLDLFGSFNPLAYFYLSDSTSQSCLTIATIKYSKKLQILASMPIHSNRVVITLISMMRLLAKCH